MRRWSCLLLLAGQLGAAAAHAEWLNRTVDGTMGTRIVVELWADDAVRGNAAIDAVMAEMNRIDLAMSTYKPDSELSRLNARAAREPVRVSAELFDLLNTAMEYSRITGGAFDVTYASVGFMYDFRARQRPSDTAIAAALPAVNYKLVQLDKARRTVRYLREGVRIDLGGIAKGHAVDLAAEALRKAGVTAFRINAGGDLRVGGGDPQPVVLAVPDLAAAGRPVIELCAGGLASSAVVVGPAAVGPAAHFDGRTREAARAGRFVTVVAPQCALADALTKVVLALGPASAAILAAFGATAYLYAPAEGWQTLGGERST